MLDKVGSSIQQVAEVIASALQANVTIVDASLVRIAGTGPYRDKIMTRAPSNSAYTRVLASKKSIVIENPGQDESCQNCPEKSTCVETFEICTPIIRNGAVVGIIGIFAFDETQKLNLLEKKQQYLNFLAKMSELIASKLGEQILYEQVINYNTELNAVIENVSQGVLCANQHGQIKHVNARALELLGFKDQPAAVKGRLIHDLWPGSLLQKALADNSDIRDKEETCNTRFSRRGLMTTVKVIRQKDTITGAVATYSDAEDVHKSAFRAWSQGSFTFVDLIGKSRSFLKVKSRAIRAAEFDSTILITGESGSGKELFARAIHNASKRAEQPFVAINCSAIPETLLESELFGYEPGAFTGASKSGKPGRIELADRGTLFLDEIGDMPLFLQAKLLRTLQERSILKIGGLNPIPVDVRILAATNKNIEEFIAKKLFREDLYYRINVVPLELPPLRERKEDIPVFIDHFLAIYNSRFNKQVAGVSPEVLELLQGYSWPGNVRELENIIEYGINITENSVISIEDIRDRFNLSDYPDNSMSLKEKVREYEEKVLNEYLDRFGWDESGKDKAARKLGLSRATLYRKLKR